MNAKKCERCGNLFEGMCVPDITVKHYRHPYGEVRHGLCPNCQKELEDWLKKENFK